MQMESLRDLFIEQLKDIYNAENQITKALPKMAKAASSSELQSAFQEHLERTQEQIKRLDRIFKDLGKNPKGKKCKGMEGLIEEGKEVMEEISDPQVLDAGLIAAAQRVEHYEISAYGTVRTFARMLGEKRAVELLEQTLEEEGAADEKLTELAESNINMQANDEGNPQQGSAI